MNQQQQQNINYNQSLPSLPYKQNQNEGQCILLGIHPIERSTIRFILYIILSICTVGLFALFVYWYRKFQKNFIYSDSTLEQATHFYILNYDNQYTIVQKQKFNCYSSEKSQFQVIGFVNRYMKYVILEGTVQSIEFSYRKRIQNIMTVGTPHGLDQEQVKNLRDFYGPGTMIIEQPNMLILFVRQVFRPLYLFIIFSVALWTYEQYYYYAGVIFFTSAVSVAINLYQVRELNKKIFHMAYYDIPVNVLRQDSVVQISSVEVVPGDIVFLKEAIKLPFEGIILEGSALINQCALTGQSVPIVKKADVLQKYKSQYTQLDKSAYVYEGTTIVQINMKKKMVNFQQYRQTYGIPVCVIRTNFVTMKGQLIRIITFPRQQQNEFQKQSSKFLIFLFCLAVASYCILIARLHKVVQTKDLIIKFLDLITITVPPGLPVSMTFGIIFAIQKLRKKQIFCISPNKIIVGGRVKFACFDKTGTLTEDFMDFYGLVPCHQKKVFPFIQSIQNKQGSINIGIDQILQKNPYIASALGNMASNHSIIQIQNTGQLVGDPMEIKLFQFGQFELDFSQNNPDIVFSYSSKRNHKGVIYRRFQFDSDVQRMSVVASNSMFGNDIYCYCKGSPQIMLQIMDKSTVPQNYHDVLKQYASRGFRVLAIASKKIKKDPKNIQRADAQCDLLFDGFQVFENKLKKQSFDAIQDLKSAEIGCVMITGDNPLTGSNIAFKCQIAYLHKKMLICDYRNKQFHQQQFLYHEIQLNNQKRKQYYEKKQEKGQKVSQNVANNQLQLSKHSSNSTGLRKKLTNENNPYNIDSADDLVKSININQPVSASRFANTTAQAFMKKIIKKAQNQNYQLCLTGALFNQLFSGVNSKYIDPLRKEFISHVTVYSRTKPNDKARIVTVYQKMGNITVMCGDGANDCGALKQADVGLSLSQAEASISAPFTSKVFNISAVVELIKQCRAGLATNFSLFNIMALYSLIQYTSTIITQYYYSYPADFQYLYWDLCGNFFFFLTFGYTGTVKTLSKHIPNISLFCATNIFQVIFMFVIQLIGQICMIVTLYGTFGNDISFSKNGGQEVNRKKYDQDGFVLDSPQTNIIFLFTNFMYIFSLLAFSISKPWRKEFWTNIPFMVVLCLVGVYSYLICMVPSARFFKFQIVHMNSDRMNGFILGMALLFGFFIYCMQKYVWEPLTYKLKQKYPDKTWL